MHVRADPCLWLTLLLAAGLLFTELDGRGLWQDEAETAVLARHVLRFGLPYAWDGKNLVSQELGRDSDAQHLWRWSPWLQIYLAAGSIGLLGPTTLAPRLPFVLLGWLTVPITYLLGRRLFGSVAVGRWSSLLLTLSVPFLLHARQARWHGPAYLLSALFLLALLGLRQGRRGAVLLVALVAVLLFQTNYFLALGLLPAALAATAVCWPQRTHLLRLIAAGGLCVLLFVPGLLFFDAAGKSGRLDPEQIGANLAFYAAVFVGFLLPLPVLGVLALALWDRRPVPDLAEDWKRTAAFLLLFVAAFVCYLSLAPWGMFRYATVLLPAIALLLGLTTAWLWSRRVWLGVAFAVVLAGSDLWHGIPLAWLDGTAVGPAERYPAGGPVGSPLLGYLAELADPPQDPEDALAAYLSRHARPDDTLLITYGDLPLQYYTELQVVGGLQGLPLPSRPKWVVVRAGTVTNRPGGDADVARFVQQHVPLADYEVIVLPCPDVLLGANPDPWYHRFQVSAGENMPPVRLLHLRHKRTVE